MSCRVTFLAVLRKLVATPRYRTSCQPQPRQQCHRAEVVWLPILLELLEVHLLL